MPEMALKDLRLGGFTKVVSFWLEREVEGVVIKLEGTPMLSSLEKRI